MKELILRPLGETERLLKLQVNNLLLTQTLDAASVRKEAPILPTHVSCSLLVTEHVRVRCHNRRPRLFRDTGGLRSSFALVYQLLHCVCDAFVTQKSGTNKRKVKNIAITGLKSIQMRQTQVLPFLESLLPHPVVFRLSIFVKVWSESLWILLISRCKAQLKNSLVEPH